MAQYPSIAVRPPGATARARRLRDDATDAEARLWRELRDRRLGDFKFARQVPLGPFTADFLCRSKRLVVEVDGEQHALADAADERRTAFLAANGYGVLRFWNGEVMRGLDLVLDTILAVLNRHITEGGGDLRYNPPAPRRRPSPGRPAGRLDLSRPGRGETRAHLASPGTGEAESGRSPEPGEGRRGPAGGLGSA